MSAQTIPKVLAWRVPPSPPIKAEHWQVALNRIARDFQTRKAYAVSTYAAPLAVRQANEKSPLGKPQPSRDWPRLMRAETAAAYVDEVSTEAFLRSVGKIYPKPIRISGKGNRWPREELDKAIDRLAGRGEVRSLADDL